MSDDLDLSGASGHNLEKSNDVHPEAEGINQSRLPGSVSDPSPPAEEIIGHPPPNISDDDDDGKDSVSRFDRIKAFQEIREVLQGLCDVTAALDSSAGTSQSIAARNIAAACHASAIDHAAKTLLAICDINLTRTNGRKIK